MLSIEKQIMYLLSSSTDMEAKELIRIYARRGYSEQSIRNTLSRLKKDDYIVSPARSSYRLTDSGLAYIRSINQKPLLYNKAWDGTWYLVMVEFPESERKIRDRFRTDILQMGFGLLYDSVYISPWNYREQVEELLNKHGFAGRVSMFQGGMILNEVSAELARKIWMLDELERLYETKRDWFEQAFLPEADPLLKNPHADPLDLFVSFLHLGEVTSELYLADPMLPGQLLPETWQGKAILEQFQQVAERLKTAIPEQSPYKQLIK